MNIKGFPGLFRLVRTRDHEDVSAFRKEDIDPDGRSKHTQSFIWFLGIIGFFIIAWIRLCWKATSNWVGLQQQKRSFSPRYSGNLPINCTKFCFCFLKQDYPLMVQLLRWYSFRNDVQNSKKSWCLNVGDNYIQDRFNKVTVILVVLSHWK